MALTTKQKLFCYYYLKLGNPKEAAILAGYPKFKALYEGTKILSSSDADEYLSRLCSDTRRDGAEVVMRGLERLAFGSANDAVRLAFSDEEDLNIETLNLFNVSEIKRQKGGAVEIKFFDRLKALEALNSLNEQNDSDGIKDFFDALRQSGESVQDESDNEI